MEGRGCLDLSATLKLKGAMPEALAAAERALAIAVELDDDEARGECSTRVAAIHLATGKPSLALAPLQYATRVWEGITEGLRDTVGMKRANEGEVLCDDPEYVAPLPTTCVLNPALHWHPPFQRLAVGPSHGRHVFLMREGFACPLYSPSSVTHHPQTACSPGLWRWLTSTQTRARFLSKPSL